MPSLHRPDSGKVFVVLREHAGASDVLRGAFHAHLLLHKIDKAGGPGQAVPDVSAPAGEVSPSGMPEGTRGWSDAQSVSGEVDRDMLGSVRKQADVACPQFLQACQQQGWDLHHTMLNPHEPRLLVYVL